jgi:nucleotide-binding universal stress UspA family protein
MPLSSSAPIVVGVDGSADALEAVRWARGAASGGQRAIHLIEAVRLPPIPGDSWLRTAASLIEAEEREARDHLELAAAGLRAAGIETVIHVRRWRAVESVLELAAEIHAGMIVVGRKGRSARQTLLGSVSGELSRRSPVPVAVVRGGPAQVPPRRILVALDGSPASRAAATAAVAWFPEAEILAATVRDPAARDVDATGEKELLRPLAGAATVRVLRLDGEPAAALLAAAAGERVDLVCAGRRGQGSLHDLLVGGVAEKLLQLAPTPLLLAH